MKNSLVHILCLLSILLVSAAAAPVANGAGGAPPVISAVSPNSIKNDLDFTITISGDNFGDSDPGLKPVVWLNTTRITDVDVASATQMTARIPWGLTPGDYQLTVVNPDGQQAAYSGSFTILSGVGGWSAQPLNGGSVDAIVFSPHDPNVVFAWAGNTGLFKSVDGGATWSAIYLKYVQVTGLALDPQDPALMFLTDGNWLFRSVDGGVNWAHIEIPQNVWQNGSGSDFSIPVVHPTSGRVLVAGFTFMPSSPPDGGIVCSDDHGDTWKSCSSGLGGAQIEPISFHPDNPNDILAGAKDGRIFRSLNGGDSWVELANPLPGYYIGYLAHNPHNPAQIWVSGWHDDGSRRAMRSIGTNYADIANNWEEVNPFGNSAGVLAVFSPFTPGEVLAHVHGGSAYKSMDGGDTWTHSVSFPQQGINSLSYHPTDPDVIFAAVNRNGILKTSNAQDNPPAWESSNQGLAGLVPQQLAIPADRPDLVYALIPYWPGLFRYRQDLSGWEFLPGVSGPDIFADIFAIDPHHPEVIFRGTLDENGQGRMGISSDRGLTWVLGGLLPPTEPYAGCTIVPSAVAFNPAQPGWAVAGSRNDCGGWWFTEEGSLYQTKDGGASWQAAAMPSSMKHIVAIAYDTYDPTIVYASTRGSGVLRSVDSGATWEKVGEDQLFMADVDWIAAEPVPPYRVFAEDCYSSDHGETWVNWRDGKDIDWRTNQMIFAGGQVSKLYAATDAGLMVSTDGANHWSPVPGLLEGVPVSTIAAVQMGERTILYAGTGGGVVASQQAAASQAMAAGESIISPGVYRLTTIEKRLFLPLVTR